MTITGKLFNESSRTIASDKMGEYASRISSALVDTYGITDDKFKVEVNVNITVASNSDPLPEKDHAFRIVDDGKLPDSANTGGFRPNGVIGHAAFGELGVYLNEKIVNDNKPATTGANVSTGKTDTGGATLERTSAHETGHTATLAHPARGTEPKSLMHQTGESEAGMKVGKDEIIKMKEAYDNDKLNKGRQRY